MSDDYQRIEVITGAARRRLWSTEEKLRIVDETLRSGESISVIARRHGVAANLLYGWRRLERQLGRKTLEVEILKEALARSRTKKPSLLAMSPLRDDFR